VRRLSRIGPGSAGALNSNSIGDLLDREQLYHMLIDGPNEGRSDAHA